MSPNLQNRYQDHSVTVGSVVTGPLDNNVYVITCRSTGRSIMVDAPGGDPALLADLCTTHGVETLLLTHSHWDHIGSLQRLEGRGLTPLVGVGDEPELRVPFEVVDSERNIAVGNVTARLLLTPGHTPGSMCIALHGAPVLFTGDTLFPGGPGGTGRAGSDFATIMQSVRRLCGESHPDTLVFPGHGAETTIRREAPHLDEWQARGW